MLDPAVARRIRLLGFDVDGVLTENDVYIGEVAGERVEFKRFDVQDGLGFSLLRGGGIDVAWVTGRVSRSTVLRGEELRVATVLTVPASAKVPAVERMLEEKGLQWGDMAFVGDDIADIPVLERVGLAIAVANARDEVKAVAHHVTTAAGGRGAAREVIELVLKSRGEWDTAVSRFFARAEART